MKRNKFLSAFLAMALVFSTVVPVWPASVLYPEGKDHILDGTAGDLTSGGVTVKMSLVDTGTYTYDAAHNYYDDVSGVVGTPGTLDNCSATAGVFDCDDEVFTSVSGASIEAVIIWVDTAGASSTDPLIAYIELSGAVTPNGGNITIQFDSGANKIFAL